MKNERVVESLKLDVKVMGPWCSSFVAFYFRKLHLCFKM